MCFSRSGRRTACALDPADFKTRKNVHLFVLDTSTGAPVFQKVVKVGNPFSPTAEGLYRYPPHTPLALSPDGRWIAAAVNYVDSDNAIMIWDVNSSREILRIKGHQGVVMSIEFSPDGNRLLYCSTVNNKPVLRLCDVTNGMPLLVLQDDREYYVSTYRSGFKADGTKIVAFGRSLNDTAVAAIWDATPLPEQRLDARFQRKASRF